MIFANSLFSSLSRTAVRVPFWEFTAPRPRPLLHRDPGSGEVKLPQDMPTPLKSLFIDLVFDHYKLLTVFQGSDNFCLFLSVAVGRWEVGTAQSTILLMSGSERSWFYAFKGFLGLILSPISLWNSNCTYIRYLMLYLGSPRWCLFNLLLSLCFSFDSFYRCVFKFIDIFLCSVSSAVKPNKWIHSLHVSFLIFSSVIFFYCSYPSAEIFHFFTYCYPHFPLDSWAFLL